MCLRVAQRHFRTGRQSNTVRNFFETLSTVGQYRKKMTPSKKTISAKVTLRVKSCCSKETQRVKITFCDKEKLTIKVTSC